AVGRPGPHRRRHRLPRRAARSAAPDRPPSQAGLGLVRPDRHPNRDCAPPDGGRGAAGHTARLPARAAGRPRAGDGGVMTTHRLWGGDTLLVRVNGGPWQTATFKAADFHDLAEARADELAAVLGQLEGVTATVDETGSLVLATVAGGSHVTLEVDASESSAANALGLSGARAASTG